MTTRYDLIRRTAERMGKTAKALFSGLELPCAGRSVSGPLVRVLFAVGRSPAGVTVKELAASLRVTAGAASQFVESLAVRGLVTRTEDPHDRRLVRIRLSDDCERDFGGFTAAYGAALKKAFASLSDKEIATLCDLLDRVEIPPASQGSRSRT